MATPVVQELLDIKAQVRRQDFKFTSEQRERYDYLTLLRKEQIKNGLIFVKLVQDHCQRR